MNRVLTAAFLSLTAALPAQFDRELRTPTEHRSFFNFQVSGIDSLIAQGYRLTDLEVIRTTRPMLFTGKAVRNTGDYQSAWWWYYGLTANQLLTKAGQHEARLIDVERYEVGGVVRYAGVMLRNMGPSHVDWWLWTEASSIELNGLTSRLGARLIDIDVHQVNGSNRYTALAIRNTGEHQRSWWWYTNTTFAYMNQKSQEHHARVVDVERMSSGRYASIMVRDNISPWAWYFNVSAARVLDRESFHKMRVIDVEQYLDGGTPRWLALYIDNIEQFAPIGTACNTTVGPLDHDVESGQGFINRFTRYRGRNLKFASPSVLHIGFTQLNVPLGAIAPGCSLYASPDVQIPFNAPASGVQTVPLFVPNDENLVGIEVFTQFASIENNGGNLHLATSNGLRTCIRGL